jgi:putative MATE family efflux protein
MSSSSTKAALTSGSIGGSLLRMTGPMTVGILANMLFNLVDTYFIGKLGKEELAAMAFTFPLVFFVTGSSMGMSIGVSSVVSRAIGAGEEDRVRRITTHSLLLGMTLVLILLAIGYPLLNRVLRAMGATPDLIPLVRDYMIPWGCGIIFIVIPMLGNSVIRSTGDTLVPSAVMLTAGGLNVLLDPLLIFGWGPFPALGLRGAALATVASYVAVFIVMLMLLQFKYRLLHIGAIRCRSMLQSWREVMEIALPAVFTNQMIPLANGILTAMIASQGQAAVAAWGVSTRLESLMMSPFFALSTVMAPFVGQNTGADRSDRIRDALVFCGKICMGGALAVWLTAALAGPWIAPLFSPRTDIQSLIRLHLWIVPAGYGAFAWKLQYTSAFNAQRKPLYSSATFLGRFFLFMIPFAWLGREHYGMPGLFSGLALANLCALVLARVLWRFSRRQHANSGN